MFSNAYFQLLVGSDSTISPLVVDHLRSKNSDLPTGEVYETRFSYWI